MLQCQNTPGSRVIGSTLCIFCHAQLKFGIVSGSLTLYPACYPAWTQHQLSCSTEAVLVLGCFLSVAAFQSMRISKGLASVMDFCVIQTAVPVTKYRR